MRRVSIIAVIAPLLAGRADADAAPICHDAKVAHADFAMAAGRLRACYAGKRRETCFALDRGTWVTAAAPRADGREPIVPDVTMGTTAVVCAPDGKNCHTFVTPRTPVSAYVGPQIYANADRTAFAVSLDDKVWLYEPSGALHATITTWPHPGDVVWSVSHVVVAGYRAYVMMRDGMNAEARAYDLRDGSPSTDIGTIDPVEPIDLGGGRVGFVTRHGASLDVYDAAAKRVRSVALFGAGGPTTVFARAGGDTIVAARWDDSSIAVVDMTTWTAKTVAAPPPCP